MGALEYLPGVNESLPGTALSVGLVYKSLRTSTEGLRELTLRRWEEKEKRLGIRVVRGFLILRWRNTRLHLSFFRKFVLSEDICP